MRAIDGGVEGGRSCEAAPQGYDKQDMDKQENKNKPASCFRFWT